jgi:glyoxylase-like metal-dependent hydrolase (beta-lactamase superfamily II)
MPAGGATAQYLANAAVLLTDGATKVVFDPLFRNDFGMYERPPDTMERALFAGTAPFDGLDAVFVSHHHEDHFSAADVLRLLERGVGEFLQEDVRLAIDDAVPLQDGRAAERLREMTLARPGRPEQEDVFSLEDETGGRQLASSVAAGPYCFASARTPRIRRTPLAPSCSWI